jgi:GNAT superfamily N-acetyltransferase
LRFLIPGDDTAPELDGLFVEPAGMRRGIGRALAQDACRCASANGALLLDVIAGLAQPQKARAASGY